VPENPVALGDVLFVDILGPLTRCEQSEPSLAPPLANPDKHLREVVAAALLRDVLVGLLRDDQKWLLLGFLFEEQVTYRLIDERVLLIVIKEIRHIKDDRYVLLECKFG